MTTQARNAPECAFVSALEGVHKDSKEVTTNNSTNLVPNLLGKNKCKFCCVDGPDGMMIKTAHCHLFGFVACACHGSTILRHLGQKWICCDGNFVKVHVQSQDEREFTKHAKILMLAKQSAVANLLPKLSMSESDQLRHHISLPIGPLPRFHGSLSPQIKPLCQILVNNFEASSFQHPVALQLEQLIDPKCFPNLKKLCGPLKAEKGVTQSCRANRPLF